MTEVIIVRDEDEAGDIYARCVGGLIARRPDCVLGLATGSSPLAAYRALARVVRERGLDVSRVRGFALDEYVGLDPGDPRSYRSTIDRTVVGPLGLDPALVHVPDGNADDVQEAGHRYDEAIARAGGVDVQVLGVGTDGHIGFNEPGSSLGSGTRFKTLARRTREDNARFFGGDVDRVPAHCVTQGIGTILKARHLILLAFGEGKAEAVAASVEGAVSSWCPASALQLHGHATVIVDEAAASRLRGRDYYRYAYDHKPAWQEI